MPYIYRDTNGQSWEVIVNPDGSLSTAAVASAPVGVPGINTTLTVQSVVNYASVHAELMPIAGVGGYTNEPALSLANDTLAEILSPPFAWKFNRKTMPLFVLSQNRQDYKFAGAVAFTLQGANVVGGVGIDLASNNGLTQVGTLTTVNTLNPHNFSVGDTVYLKGCTNSQFDATEIITPSSSSWSGGYVITAVPSSTSFQFVTAGSLHDLTSGAPGIYDFGWLEYATMVNENETSSPRRVFYLTASRTLQPTSTAGVPNKIAASDNGDGTLSIRFSVVPSSVPFGATLVYQGRAPLLLNLTDTFAPVTDQYAYIIRQMFLAKAFKFVGASRWLDEYKQSQADIQKALAQDDSEASEEYIVPTESLLGDGVYY